MSPAPFLARTELTNEGRLSPSRGRSGLGTCKPIGDIEHPMRHSTRSLRSPIYSLSRSKPGSTERHRSNRPCGAEPAGMDRISRQGG